VRAASVTAALLLAATPLAAQQEPPLPRTHVVQPGETLWDIARAYLSDPFLWPEIFRLNAAIVRDPALIYPRQRLVLPGATRTAPQVALDADPWMAAEPEPADERPRLIGADRVQRPAVAEGDFYRASFLARDAEVTPVGMLAEQRARAGLRTRMPPQINLYDRVFVRLDRPGSVEVGERLHFLRRGREIRPLGRVFQPTAVGTVEAVDGSTATVMVVRLYDRAEIGDLAVPVVRFPLTADARAVATRDLPGRILAFQDDRPLQMQHSILFLDVGRSAGVAVGDEFEAYVPRGQETWGERPEISVARMQVVRVTDGSASVRVTGMEQPAIEAGLPVRRVARMP
jgi:LysM repeat protein